MLWRMQTNKISLNGTGNDTRLTQNKLITHGLRSKRTVRRSDYNDQNSYQTQCSHSPKQVINQYDTCLEKFLFLYNLSFQFFVNNIAYYALEKFLKIYTKKKITILTKKGMSPFFLSLSTCFLRVSPLRQKFASLSSLTIFTEPRSPDLSTDELA